MAWAVQGLWFIINTNAEVKVGLAIGNKHYLTIMQTVDDQHNNADALQFLQAVLQPSMVSRWLLLRGECRQVRRQKLQVKGKVMQAAQFCHRSSHAVTIRQQIHQDLHSSWDRQMGQWQQRQTLPVA